MTRLTQSAFLAFGRAVPYLVWFALFPRYARKKRKQMIVKDLSVAGEMGRQRGPPRKSCK
jgi:hypothetical protein